MADVAGGMLNAGLGDKQQGELPDSKELRGFRGLRPLPSPVRELRDPSDLRHPFNMTRPIIYD